MSENNESPKTEKPTFRRVLVVEDDEGLNKLAQKALREIGCSAVGTSNGAEAIEYVMTSPDVVLLLDIKLPDITGGELISVLNERGCSVPFIAMTGHGDERTAVEMMKLGARDYLVKDLDLVHRLPGVFERLFRELDTERNLRTATDALRESEAKYRGLVEATSDWVWEIDIDGRFIYASPQVENILGYAPDEMMGMTAFDLLAEDEVAGIRETYNELVARRAPMIGMVNVNLHKDRRRVVLESNATPVFDESGALKGYRGIDRDITERKRAEDVLAKIQMQHEEAQRVAHIGHWEIELPSMTIRWSEEIFRIFGLEPDSAAPSYEIHPTLVHPDDWDQLNRAITAAADKGLPYDTEFRILRPDGSVRWVHSIGTVARGKDDRTQSVFGTAQDITERKQAEEALRESEKLFHSIFDYSAIGIALVSLEGRFVSANKAVEAILGYTTEEILGLNFAAITYPEDRDLSRSAFERLLGGKCEHYHLEKRYLHKDGHIVWGAPSCSLILDAAERASFVVAQLQNIDDRKKAEEARRQLEQQMQQTQKLESLGVMAGGIAHDFNNILCAILGNADIALEAMPPEAVGRSSLHEIQTAARRASGLTDQMLAYSGKGLLAIEKMHLSELVQEMAHLLEVSHTKKAILKYRFEESLPAIEGDPSQLRQVVMNLITNASEAEGDKGGIIAVTTGVTEATAEYLAATYANDGLPAGRYVYLEVTDTGCGMDEETQRRIFEPFFTTKFTGRGLGMAAVLGIVRAHKGAIDIQSEVDHGTAIKVLFPALDEAAASPTEEPPQEEDWRGSGTVLVVDDETSILKLTKRLLERKGFAVLTAEDGKQAVEVFRENRDAIACVVTDLTMPRMGGEEALVEIHQIRKDVPVVLASGFSEEQLKERVQNLGFAGFLKKPFQNRDLLDKVRAVLNL